MCVRLCIGCVRGRGRTRDTPPLPPPPLKCLGTLDFEGRGRKGGQEEGGWIKRERGREEEVRRSSLEGERRETERGGGDGTETRAERLK